MVNKNSKFFKLKKPFIAILCAITVGSTCLAAACTPDESDKDSNPSPTTREDNQLLKNGDFEYFSFPDADDGYHYIRTPNNWSRGGTSSQTMSGIISTSKTAWDKITSSTLKDELDYNNDLDTSSDEYEDNYKNFNAMESSDLLYKDAYVANLTETQLENNFQSNVGGFADYFQIERKENGENYTYFMGETQVYLDSEAVADDWKDSSFFLDEALTLPVREQFITNPETHYNVLSDTNGLYYMDGTTRVTVLEDEETDSYYYEKDGDKIYISNILMVHNTESSNNGISQYYSSQSITLEANTACEISLWVKTSDLKYDKGHHADEDKGAFIEVTQTVNSTDLDSFIIKSINTEKLISEGAENSNGWINYTVLVNATDFADCTISISVGLGNGTNSEYVSGYAFFDDIQVTKSITLSDEQLAKVNDSTTCTLTAEEEDRTFIADTATILRKSIVGNAKYASTTNLKRSSKDFNFYVNLTSTGVTRTQEYSAITFNQNNVSSYLTYEETTNYLGQKIQYVPSTSFNGTAQNVTVTQPGNTSQLAPNLNGAAVETNNDMIGIFSADHNYTGAYANLFNTQLNKNGITNLPQYKKDNNILLIHSVNGAAYTTTVSNEQFTVSPDEYKILTFWVKTSDLSGNMAATLKIYDKADKDDTVTSFSIDSTDIVTDIGDEKNIYNGWAQCFFFVHNDTEDDKQFNVDFCYGISTISTSTSIQYKYGYAALANMQILTVDEDIYNMTTAGDYALSFSFTETAEEESDTPFDTVSGTSNIKNGISDPANYNGVNGGSSLVSNNEYNENYDRLNSNSLAGLINRDEFDNYPEVDKSAILSSFISTAQTWNDVFGSDSYQPLVILNSLRTYSTLADATAETFKNYYVKDDNGDFVKVAANAVYDENTEYYSLSYAKNYGYISSNQSIGSDSYTIISVKVLVGAGATAHLYLVDSDSKEVLEFETPDYTYYYDDEGNVLDEAFDSDWKDSEHRSHIVYSFRDDGLYEDNTGKLFANLHNYIKTYNHYSYQQLAFYKDGERVDFDDLKDGETYYSDQACTVVSKHFLSTSDGTRVYEYEDGKYYYLVDHTDDDDNTYKVRGEIVENFATTYAKTTPTQEKYLYHTEVGDTKGKWVTVNFIVHTGSESKSYRMELWNGERGESGVTLNSDGTPETTSVGAVAFDYSSYSVTESNYSTLLSEYENRIINGFKSLLFDKGLGNRIDSNNENIAYYEKLIEQLIADGELTEADIKDLDETYTALYYTYSLFDSSAYIPFNADTAADGETGYVYTASSFNETLAYFNYNVKDGSGNTTIYNTFVDYTTIDQDIENGRITDDDDDTDEGTEANSNIWLLISSIILVVVLLFTIASIIFRELYKKRSRRVSRKAQSKNVYRQRERYIRKLGLVKTEDEIVENKSENDNKSADEASNETTDENEVVESTETGNEETQSEEPATDEETTVEAESNDAPTSDEEPKQ